MISFRMGRDDEIGVSALVVFEASFTRLPRNPNYPPKVEKVTIPVAVAEQIHNYSMNKAPVIKSDDDKEVMTVWFRTEIPAKFTEEQVKNGLTLPRDSRKPHVSGADSFSGEVH